MNMAQFVASTSSKMAKDNTTGNKAQSPAATASNVAQSPAATTSDIVVDDDDRKPAAVSFAATTGNKTHPPAATASSVAQSLAATTSVVAADDDHRKPAGVLFEEIATARNATQLLEAITGNNTQLPAATASNASHSLAATTSDIAVDDCDRKPAAVSFEAIITAPNLTQLLASTTVKKT
jgi:hypothetical protein